MAEFKIPTEIVTLPSKGLLYPKESPLSAGEIEMKYMTAKEEDILTNANYLRNGTVLDKLLQALIIDDINYNDLLIGDKNAIMVAARILGYGKYYTINHNGKEVIVDLSQLKDKTLNEELFKIGINEFTFEGLITSFNFTYTSDATIEANISLTGTSNVYTDVSMYLSTPNKKEDNPKKDPKIVMDPVIGPTYQTTAVTSGASGTPGTSTTQSFAARAEFYDQLYNRFETLINDFCTSLAGDETAGPLIKDQFQILIPFTLPKSTVKNPTDHYILAGQQYLPKLQETDIPEIKDTFKLDPNSLLSEATQKLNFLQTWNKNN